MNNSAKPPFLDYQAKWIHFKWAPAPKRQTWIFHVLTKTCDPAQEVLLGEIGWFASWRKYCFFPGYNTIYETKCLQDIIDFINLLMLDHQKYLKRKTDENTNSSNNNDQAGLF